MAGSAHASSFVTLGALSEKISPSMVVLGQPAPPIASFPDASRAKVAAATDARVELSYPVPGGDTYVRISPSIIAMGSPAPAVSNEKLASITRDAPKPTARRSSNPMVIRGGIVGDAFGKAASSPITIDAPTQAVSDSGPTGVAQGAPTGSKEKPIRQPREPDHKEPIAPPPPARLPD